MIENAALWTSVQGAWNTGRGTCNDALEIPVQALKTCDTVLQATKNLHAVTWILVAVYHTPPSILTFPGRCNATENMDYYLLLWSHSLFLRIYTVLSVSPCSLGHIQLQILGYLPFCG